VLHVIDPTRKEQVAAQGSATFTFNAHKEICGIHKAGGLLVPLVEVCDSAYRVLWYLVRSYQV